MQQNKALAIGVIATIIGFFIIGIIVYLGLQAPAPEATPMQSIPLENVSETNTIYEIIPEESEARFILSELLRGIRTTVVGSTNQVAGQLGVDSANLASAQVGVILIDARALATDNNFRNNTMRNDILFAQLYPFIRFEPTMIEALPSNGSVEVDQVLTFQIVGDLTIRDVTNPATFTVTAVSTATGNIEGSATTTIQRSDYQLEIPAVPGVADVDDKVTLEFDFVAAPVVR